MRVCILCTIALAAALWGMLGVPGLLLFFWWLAVVCAAGWWGERRDRLTAERLRDHWLSRYTDTTESDLDAIIDRECCR